MKIILIVEDDQAELRALKNKFESEGFSVVTAKDGEEGFEKSIADRPDIILTDILMPKMDGISMFKKLQEDEWGKTVPVMFLTNLNFGDTNLLPAFDKNIDLKYFLVKTDWTLDDIVKKVNDRLNSK